ncbi:MGMT family protein [Bacillus subtilis]
MITDVDELPIVEPGPLQHLIVRREAELFPCHRVIGSSGKLTGFAGGLSEKQRLLEIEQQK